MVTNKAQNRDIGSIDGYVRLKFTIYNGGRLAVGYPTINNDSVRRMVLCHLRVHIG